MARPHGKNYFDARRFGGRPTNQRRPAALRSLTAPRRVRTAPASKGERTATSATCRPQAPVGDHGASDQPDPHPQLMNTEGPLTAPNWTARPRANTFRDEPAAAAGGSSAVTGATSPTGPSGSWRVLATPGRRHVSKPLDVIVAFHCWLRSRIWPIIRAMCCGTGSSL